MGILMLGSLALLGLSDIHGMNAVKTILASVINAVGVVFFLVKPYFDHQTVIDWPRAIPMIGAGIVGGYYGARIARRLDKNLIRRCVVAIGFTLTAIYFYSLSLQPAAVTSPIMPD
jgi:hypothetical protein